MEFFIFVLVVVGIYLYLKSNKSQSNFKSPDSSYKRNSNSYSGNKSTHSGGSYETTLVEGNKLLIESAISGGKKLFLNIKINLIKLHNGPFRHKGYFGINLMSARVKCYVWKPSATYEIVVEPLHYLG